MNWSEIDCLGDLYKLQLTSIGAAVWRMFTGRTDRSRAGMSESVTAVDREYSEYTSLQVVSFRSGLGFYQLQPL